LSIYADAARLCGGITEDKARLEAAAVVARTAKWETEFVKQRFLNNI
jgi:hypothetical protein